MDGCCAANVFAFHPLGELESLTKTCLIPWHSYLISAVSLKAFN